MLCRKTQVSGTCFGINNVAINHLPIVYLQPLPFGPPPATHHKKNGVLSLAEQILLSCVTWACSLPAFSSLVEMDKKALLEASWAELFVLAVAEKGLMFDAGIQCDILRIW